MVSILPSSFRPPSIGEESYRVSDARSTCGRPLSPAGEGAARAPPPPACTNPIVALMSGLQWWCPWRWGVGGQWRWRAGLPAPRQPRRDRPSRRRQDAVVCDFQGFGGHLDRVEVQAGAGPAHGHDPDQRPFGDLLVEPRLRGDDHRGRLDAVDHPGEPLGQLRAVGANGSGQLDVGVLHPGGQLPDHRIVATLLALFDDELTAQTLAAVEHSETVVVDADLETDADCGILVGHGVSPRCRW